MVNSMLFISFVVLNLFVLRCFFSLVRNWTLSRSTTNRSMIYRCLRIAVCWYQLQRTLQQR